MTGMRVIPASQMLASTHFGMRVQTLAVHQHSHVEEHFVKLN